MSGASGDDVQRALQGLQAGGRSRSAEQGAGAGCLQRPLRSRFQARLRAGVRPLRMDGFPILFKFFPGTRQLTARFPPVGEILAVFEAEGFCVESAQRIPQNTCQSLREFAVRTKLRADSTLVLLPDSEFEACQTALEEAASRERVPSPVIETIELLALRPSRSRPPHQPLWS